VVIDVVRNFRAVLLWLTVEKTMIMMMITEEVHLRSIIMLVGVLWSRNDVTKMAFVSHGCYFMCKDLH
jgi:hypothetical protein